MKRLLASGICLLFMFFFAFLIYLRFVGDKPREGAPILYLGPSSVTQDSDREYQAVIQNAQGFVARGQFEVAANEYFQASRINRFYLPSYYPLLQAAKLKMKTGKKEEATHDLESFAAFAKEELRIIPPKNFKVQDTTPEHEASVKKQLKEAEQLLSNL